MYGAEPFRVSGEWWSPDRPEDRWSGTLSFESAEGGRLTLLAPHPEEGRARIGDLGPVLHGIAVEGMKFTLARSGELSVRSSHSGLCERQLESYLIFRGFHLPSIGSKHIRRVSVTFKHLNRWVASTGMRTRRLKRRMDFDFQYRTPASHRIRVGDDLSLTVYYFPKHSIILGGGSVNRVHPDGDFEVHERIYVEIRPARPRSWEYFERVIRVLQDFFTVAMLRLSLPTETTAELSFGEFKKIRGRRWYREADVFSFTFYAEPDEDHYTRRDSLFQEADIGHGLEAALQLWFGRSAAIYQARMLYSASQYTLSTMESQFLMLCQALESYHRSRGSDTYMPSEQFGGEVLPALVAAIPEGVSADFRQAIRGSLEHAHEYSFIRRLKLLAREHDSALRVLLNRPKALMRELSLYRNYLVHSSEPTPGFVYNQDRVAALRDVAKLLLELCFLREMGFDSEAAESCMKRNVTYRRFDHWNRAQPN